MIITNSEQHKLIKRLLKHTNQHDKCWEWAASKHCFGYGWINVNGNITVAHRVSYELLVGPIPAGFLVMHTCDNPGCVNPLHLKLGTDATNMQDKVNKGRQAKGSKNGKAKLTEEQVKTIKELDATGSYYRADLARMYGVSRSLITMILNRHNWTHV